MHAFGPFRLDCDNAQLLRGEHAVTLTPKAFAVLTQLVQANGRLVRKDALFDSVWSGTVVSESALTVCIREIRKALGDSSRAPQYIATAHKRGYRFVAKVETWSEPRNEQALGLKPAVITATTAANAIVGRETEAKCLHAAIESARQGQRHCVFVTGEAGLGKTTLVEACLQPFADAPDVRVARGQSVEHHGHVEPYLPWLDAITRLCLHDEAALAIFQRFAPMWLLQIPALLNADERAALEHQLAGANPQRMLREMLEALQAMSAERPLVIYLDDLHYGDTASVELLACVARRQDPSSLLIIACYRPVDLVVTAHPLRSIKHELQVRGLCSEITLELLTCCHVATYINTSLPNNALPKNLATAIHARTDGNPLFTLNVIAYLRKQQWLQEVEGRWLLTCDLATVETCVPESLVQMLSYHIEQLPAAVQQILQAAAIASDVGTGSVQFSSAEVAAAMQKQVGWVEEHCDQLTLQGHFLHAVEPGHWPDGTPLLRYAFNHGLYQKAFYQRVAAGQRAAWHKCIGERLAQAFVARDTDVAAELAVHFEQGRDFARAAGYLQKSAATASRRGVNRDAKNDLERALTLTLQLPNSAARARLEMQLHTALGTVLIAEQGNAAPAVERSYRYARELCEAAGDNAAMFPIVFGLRSCSLLAGRLEEAHGLGQDLLKLAENAADPDLITEAHVALASTAYFLGHFEQALAHSSAGLETYAAERHVFHVTQYGLDPGVFFHCRAAQALWSLGYPQQALRRVEAALALAQQLGHPYSLVFALNNHAWIFILRREAQHVWEYAARGVQLAEQHSFPFLLAWGQVMQGWALTANGNPGAGLELIHSGLEAPTSAAAGVRSYLLTVLADAQLKAGNYAQGLAALDEIVVGAEYFLAAERHCLRGKLIIMLAHQADEGVVARVAAAEEFFRKALECSRIQHARSYELQSVVSLAKSWSQRGRATEAEEMLAPLVSWFDEEQTTPDLVEARALLERCKSNELEGVRSL